MRKNIYLRLITACLLCTTFCVSCKQSAKNSLIGKWKINGKATVAKMDEETKKNFGGAEMAEQLLGGFNVEYKEDGTYLASGGEVGTWSISEDEKVILVTPSGKKEEKRGIIELSGTQFVVNNVASINTPVTYDVEK